MFERRSSAATHTARSIVGDTAQTALSSGGAASPELAGELQRQIAAERVAGDGERVGCRSRSISSRITNSGIVRQPGVIEAARQVLGAAAIPLVQPDDVPAGGPGLVGHAAHVVRDAGALEAVQQQQRRVVLRPRRASGSAPARARRRRRRSTGRPAQAAAETGAAWPTRRASACGRRGSEAGTQGSKVIANLN